MIINKPKLTITSGQELIDEFYKSGLKPREFCAQKNITYHMLQYWREKSKTNKLTNPKFLPVNLVQPISKPALIKITVNSKITVELPVEIDLLQFKKILEVCIVCG